MIIAKEKAKIYNILRQQLKKILKNKDKGVEDVIVRYNSKIEENNLE